MIYANTLAEYGLLNNEVLKELESPKVTRLELIRDAIEAERLKVYELTKSPYPGLALTAIINTVAYLRELEREELAK